MTIDNDNKTKPNITNYDYVWGSDQDEYVNKELETHQSHEEKEAHEAVEAPTQDIYSEEK